MAEKLINICPKCGSTKISPLVDGAHNLSVQKIYFKCDSCSHQAMIFPEINESSIEDFKEHLSNLSDEERKPEVIQLPFYPKKISAKMLLTSLGIIVIGVVLIYLLLRFV